MRVASRCYTPRMLDQVGAWLTQHPSTTNFFKFIALLIALIAGVSFLRRYLMRHVTHAEVRYKAQKGVEVIAYAVAIVLAVSYFTGNIADFALAIGLLTAGVTITLQELFLSVAGSFYIFLVQVYKPGDRIEIHGIRGDVIDIDSIYTTMMEIGEWVSSDNYSGRIVKLSNAFVFRGPIYNYSQDFPFVWDEFSLPIRYGSDRERAKQIIVQAAGELLSEYVEQSTEQWKQVVSKYYIEDATLTPTLAITLTDNWMAFNLRYIVDYRRRRATRHLLQEHIAAEIAKTHGGVALASATFEIVQIPSLDVRTHSSER